MRVLLAASLLSVFLSPSPPTSAQLREIIGFGGVQLCMSYRDFLAGPGKEFSGVQVPEMRYFREGMVVSKPIALAFSFGPADGKMSVHFMQGRVESISLTIDRWGPFGSPERIYQELRSNLLAQYPPGPLSGFYMDEVQNKTLHILDEAGNGVILSYFPLGLREISLVYVARGRGLLHPVRGRISFCEGLPPLEPPGKKIVDGDGVLRFCTVLEAFLQGAGKEFMEAPERASEELAGTRVFLRKDVWEAAGMKAPRNVLAAFAQNRLVAIVWEWLFAWGSGVGRYPFEALKRYMLDQYALEGREGWRLVLFQRVQWWFTLQDGQGNRIRVDGASDARVRQNIYRAFFSLRGFPPQQAGSYDSSTVCTSVPQ